MPSINFKKVKYDIDHVLGHFQLQRDITCAHLNRWLDVIVPNDFALPELLEEKRERLAWEVDVWNEEELKMHFLSIVFTFAKFEVAHKIKLFYERSLSATVNDTALTVICDALLASPYGINTPQKPYFFMQEFKKGKKIQDDAEGQMLIAMLIAQELNQDEKPIYGCYILGRHWYFTTLHEKKYCVSKAFDATQYDELVLILHILGHIKNIVI